MAYSQAASEVSDKLDKYLKQFADEDEEKKALVAGGAMTKAEYKSWRQKKIMYGKQWDALKDTLAADFSNVNKIAKSAIVGYMPTAYAMNHNYATYLVEHGGLVDTSYVLYDRQTVERLLADDPELLPPPGKKVSKEIAAGKLQKWQKGQIQSVTLQSILQGESIPNMAKRISHNLSTRGYRDCVRYARTAMTGAQNAGREDAYARAKAMGIKMKESWIATIDGKTRHEHRQLDGQEKDVGGFFTVDGYKIRFPGDPTAAPHLVYNCRCTTIAQIQGFERDVTGFSLRNDPAIGGMSYEEWKDEKKKETPYTKAKEEYDKAAEKVANAKGIDLVLSGIWKGKDVTYNDWMDVKDSIPAKKKYYEDQIAQLQGVNEKWAQDKIDQYTVYLDELSEYSANGQDYFILLAEKSMAKQNMDALAPQLTNAMQQANGPFDPDAYSRLRKDAALWAKSGREADDALRDRTGEVWRNASNEEKMAIFEYTKSYHKFNEPLRGIEYGTNRYLGVGNTDLNAGSARNGKRLNAMTDIIDKCTYDRDMWLQRGTGYGGMDKFFQIDESILMHGSQKELEGELLGKIVTEYGFMSCGTAKGQGFSGNPIILNIYAPKGTKAMYVEPFSYFGRGSKDKWDGLSGQSGFGSELETILQQGTQLRITKVEKSNGRLFVDLEVIGQPQQQRWTR